LILENVIFKIKNLQHRIHIIQERQE